MSDSLAAESLEYHRAGRPGKIQVTATKSLENQRDLALAYSPGVAAPVLAIEDDPDLAYEYTAKGNLVGVITNGTAILGLGNRGALASKPVMEGKGVLFKTFADIDVFDIEVNAADPDEFIQIVKAISPTFGGINLEDIKAPESFYIEERLKDEIDIPVFHDDQHGTAIIAGAGLLNGLELVGKTAADVRLVISGAGAAAISTAKLLQSLGVQPENIRMVDRRGVIYAGREAGMNPYKALFAVETADRSLADALQGADVFIGLSAAGLLKPEMVRTMARDPLIFALANPDPEIPYELAKATRSDAIVATGRSDYPNQINNVLGFPYIFRGALDVRARAINDSMKLAAAKALALLTKRPVPQVVLDAYGLETLEYGRDYLIPKPFDPRVLHWVAPAVARAACHSGCARIDFDDDTYIAALKARQARIMMPH
jgi:malate dehydrogenase (oxaloacetate-decarboxylating)(NADP+)